MRPELADGILYLFVKRYELLINVVFYLNPMLVLNVIALKPEGNEPANNSHPDGYRQSKNIYIVRGSIHKITLPIYLLATNIPSFDHISPISIL